MILGHDGACTSDLNKHTTMANTLLTVLLAAVLLVCSSMHVKQ